MLRSQNDIMSYASHYVIKKNKSLKETPYYIDEELAKKILEADEINILIDLHLGTEAASTWTCDFSYDYVKINADYRS